MRRLVDSFDPFEFLHFLGLRFCLLPLHWTSNLLFLIARVDLEQLLFLFAKWTTEWIPLEVVGVTKIISLPKSMSLCGVCHAVILGIVAATHKMLTPQRGVLLT